MQSGKLKINYITPTWLYNRFYQYHPFAKQSDGYLRKYQQSGLGYLYYQHSGWFQSLSYHYRFIVIPL